MGAVAEVVNTHFVFSMAYVGICMLVGWCGNEPWWWRRWWRKPPPPPPEPWWLIDIISLIGGLIGGFLVSQVFPGEASFLTVVVGAFVGGRLTSSVYNIITINKEVQ